MADLNRILGDNLAVVLGCLALLVLVLIVIVIIQSIRLGRAVRSYRALVGDGSPGSLAELLEEQGEQGRTILKQLNALNALHTELEARSRGSLQHVGLVRFNPFEDTGSDQSFAIALLDGEQDGIVISSLHGRTNTRLFAKPVQGGRSNHALSDEEEQAIAIAVSSIGREARNG